MNARLCFGSSLRLLKQLQTSKFLNLYEAFVNYLLISFPDSISDQESCSDNNAGCTHECIQGPFGAQCTCPVGYQLANDSKTCEDINECDPPGFCSQHCYNERGSFRCYCDEGYILETNEKTCKAAGEEHKE